MNELISITEQDGKQAVSARELHEFLEVTTRFNDWIKRMIETYDFEEGVDFITVLQKDGISVLKNEYVEYSSQQLSRAGIYNEYIMSLDMAKELSMVQRTEKGKQARQYFIECEKQLKSQALPTTYKEALLALVAEVEAKEKAEALLVEQKPKVKFAEALETSEKNCLIGELAKILNQNGVDIGQNRLFDWLRSNGYLIKRRDHEDFNMPTQKSADLKLFVIKKGTVENRDGSIRVTRTTMVTPKGQKYFINKFL